MKHLLVVALVSAAGVWADNSEEEAVKVMTEYNRRSQELKSIYSYKQWAYDTSLTDEAAKEMAEADKNYNQYQLDIYPTLMAFDWKQFKNETLKRLFWMSSFLDEAALPQEKQANLTQISQKMLDIYSTAKVRDCDAPDKDPSLNIDDVAAAFSEKYLDVDTMNCLWEEWHDTVGRPEKPLFAQWIELENETAILNNFSNNAERWHKDYEIGNFEDVIAQLFSEIEPFCKELHAYIRHKLWLTHNKDSSIVDPKGPIPASLLGNMWGLDAINIYPITMPFPDKPTLDATDQLVAQNYTGLKMAKASENFYTSMGFPKMVDSFWENSIFERGNRTMDCSPMAFRFFNGYDYRIHFCTTPTQDDFGRMHHEMGHIVQYMQYSSTQPFFFQDAGNPGMDEAFGDTVYIFATSPYHLMNLGLIDKNTEVDKELAINAIFMEAEADAFFLPYAYSLDLWRWDVMKGEITPDNYNCEYWKRRIKLHGVEPPVDRDETDFDPGAKMHVDEGLQYISYFVSGIVKYQMIKSMCVMSGFYDPNNPSDDKPLVFCDVSNSTVVGDKLKEMFRIGKSKPWPDILEVLTGQREMDTGPFMEFYQPLYDWLKQYNKKNKVKVGWNCGHHRCKCDNNNATNIQYSKCKKRKRK